jgi:hypothetical protein
MRFVGAAGAVWGIAGVSLLIGDAVYRLSLVAIDAFTYPLDWRHWVFLVVFLVFMTVSEGYLGFQRAFSPRVAARARYLARHPRVVHALFAPLFCMGFFHATRRRQISSILLTMGIVVMVVLVRQLAQPWRGIVDLGVAAGLVWGLVALGIFSYLAFTTEAFGQPTDVPETCGDA